MKINNQRITLAIVTVGLLLIMSGTLLPILRVAGSAWKYIYAAGAVILLVGRILSPTPHTDSIRLRRLFRLETWSALIFCVGAFFMFYPDAGHMDWLAFTLAGGIVQIYTSLAIPREMKKQFSK